MVDETELRSEVRAFSVFLLEELNDKIQICHEKLNSIDEKITNQHKKMMEGFRLVEKSFKLLAGAIVSLSEDLGSATGTLATDPWAFD